MMTEIEPNSFEDLGENEIPQIVTYPQRSPTSYSSQPDVVSGNDSAPFLSLSLVNEEDGATTSPNGSGGSRKTDRFAKSFLLMDEQENVQLQSAEHFCKRLGAAPESKIKVVSIFGNTGDGKSHTMNHAFFGGKEVFKTSSHQSSCTMGILASFHKSYNVLCLDTEGLLGETINENKQMRMLLKVLAISDIIIYRTRSERLRSDMYKFLGTASEAFTKFFFTALQSLSLPGTPQSLGPAVIIFHETQHTEVLKEDDEGKKEEDILRERFAKSQLDLTAFSSLRYVGIRTNTPPTNYEPLRMALEKELKNTTVRSPRQPTVVFEALLALNRQFNGELSSIPNHIFPEQFFTCTTYCKSCEARCQLSSGHLRLKEDHKCARTCKYQHQFENKVYLCNKCHYNGRPVVVTIKTQTSNDSSWLGLAKFAWSGSVIECPYCGEIYRSRQHWYGNKPPEQTSVRTEIVHVWNDGGLVTRGPTHSAQLVLDGVAYLTDALVSVGEQPTKTLKSWVADKIRPTYWRPDSEIIYCKGCTCNFERLELKKHHCRNCGDGFCSACSKTKMPVVNRGWDYPVRVCNGCRDLLSRAQSSNGTNVGSTRAASSESEPDKTSTCNSNSASDAEINVTARKYGEAVINTLSNLGAVLEYPKDLIKDSARPSYWVPDAEAARCNICELMFGSPEELNSANPLVQAGSTINGKNVMRQLALAAGDTTPPASPGNPSNNRGTALVPSPSPSPSHSSYHVIDRRRHHCRACGTAVCAGCSEHRRPVPKRGWLNDVRVCNSCFSSAD
ncbi:zinc finger FYVE domain-containing protein 1-like [Topomyia yanbarensis]|uniref:zinc finger FYVE domain-containing protein 1-like n=1 Tax=Topomyia yanbarensis TaxID=2498891 RepID=UPI00273BDFBF|nr:zinc finger FYVE domain-containing protein 1-like [Topomyia yanbarensis]